MLKNLRIRTRLFLLLGLLVLGTLVAGGYGVLSLKRAERINDDSLRSSAQLLAAVEGARLAQLGFKKQVHEFKNLLLRGHDQEQFDWYLGGFRKGSEAVVRDLDALAAAMGKLGVATDGVQEVRRLHGAIVQEHLDALKDFKAGEAETALAADRLVRGKDRQLEEKIDAVVHVLESFAETEALRLREAAAADTRRATAFFAALVAAVALLAVVAGLAVVGRLLRELGGEPAYAKDVAGRIAAGDLAVQVAVRQGDAHSVIAAMDSMSHGLRQLVTRVAAGASSVADASRQLAHGNLDLSQRTEEQATTLEETASQMEELTTIVAQNAQHAREASQLAAQASEAARRGGQVFGDVVSTMNGISASSRRISDIIGLIDGIAFQTNILALNAAVEAARAGDQGRGFAVVAAEVRNLAQRSATAAREIKTLIGDSASQVEAGTQQVDAAGRAIDEIVASVLKVTELIGGIASASTEQSAAIEQVNGAVTQMDQVVQQNAALVEQASAATESLKQQAAGLMEAVAAFRLEHAPAQAPLGRAATAAGPALQAIAVRPVPAAIAAANDPQPKRRREPMIKPTRTLAGAALLAVVIAAGASLAPPACAQHAMSEAEVKSVDKDARKVVLKTGEVKNIDMPPMTMPFVVKDAKMLDRLKVGDKIRFRAINDAGKFTITELQLAK